MSELLARWHKLTRRKQWLIAITTLVLVFAGIGAVSGGSDDTAPAATAAVATETSEAAESAAPAAPSVTGKIRGRFHRDCLACGDLAQYIEVSNVWCGWRDDKVIVHVRMINESVEHVTVNWHPSYTIAGGSDHGTGLMAQESDGFDAYETRVLESEQDPDGVYPGADLSDCKPSFFLVESG
jgi:hypothetical protein